VNDNTTLNFRDRLRAMNRVQAAHEKAYFEEQLPISIETIELELTYVATHGGTSWTWRPNGYLFNANRNLYVPEALTSDFAAAFRAKHPSIEVAYNSGVKSGEGPSLHFKW